jgi:hypothetical protein
MAGGVTILRELDRSLSGDSPGIGCRLGGRSGPLVRHDGPRDRLTCCQASRPFADLVGTDLRNGSYRDRCGPPQVVDRDDQRRVDE